MLSSRFAGIPLSSSTIDGSGVPQLTNRGEQTLRAVTGQMAGLSRNGGRDQIGTVGDSKSEPPAGLRRNSQRHADGCPVAVEVFAGNTADPATVAAQVAKLKARFGINASRGSAIAA